MTDLDNVKATSISDVFKLWEALIVDKELVSVSLPLGVVSKDYGDVQGDYASIIQQLAVGVPKSNIDVWKDSFDVDYVAWATSERSQLKYKGNKTNLTDLFVDNRIMMRKYWGEQVAAGKIPEIVVRTVTKQAK